MSGGSVPSADENFREQRLTISRYDRGIRAEHSDAAIEERREHRERLIYDDNDATAPGKICELCGSEITAGQAARLRADGWWIHEACPVG
jgi:hypothetical protein